VCLSVSAWRRRVVAKQNELVCGASVDFDGAVRIHTKRHLTGAGCWIQKNFRAVATPKSANLAVVAWALVMYVVDMLRTYCGFSSTTFDLVCGFAVAVLYSLLCSKSNKRSLGLIAYGLKTACRFGRHTSDCDIDQKNRTLSAYIIWAAWTSDIFKIAVDKLPIVDCLVRAFDHSWRFKETVSGLIAFTAVRLMTVIEARVTGHLRTNQLADSELAIKL